MHSLGGGNLSCHPIYYYKEIDMNYEYITHVVVLTAFFFIIMIDTWAVIHWSVTFAKWIWRKLHRKGEKNEAEGNH